MSVLGLIMHEECITNLVGTSTNLVIDFLIGQVKENKFLQNLTTIRINCNLSGPARNKEPIEKGIDRMRGKQSTEFPNAHLTHSYQAAQTTNGCHQRERER